MRLEAPQERHFSIPHDGWTKVPLAVRIEKSRKTQSRKVKGEKKNLSRPFREVFLGALRAQRNLATLETWNCLLMAEGPRNQEILLFQLFLAH